MCSGFDSHCTPIINKNQQLNAFAVGTHRVETARIMTKKTNATVSATTVRKSAKSVLDMTMTLKAVCAQINSAMKDEFENDGTKMSVREWFALMGYKFGAKGVTPSALAKVWHEEMRLDGDMAVWRKIPAKVGTGKDAKIVYEWNAKKGEFSSVGEYHLVKCEKWTARMVIMGLIDTWNYDAVKNAHAKNTKAIADIKKFYVTESKTATHKNVNTKMREVSKDEITF